MTSWVSEAHGALEDYEDLRQLSNVGALADQVVIAVARMSSDPSTPHPDRVIGRAASLFETVANQFASPFKVDSQARLGDALRLFAPSADDDGQPQSVLGQRDSLLEYLRGIAESLRQIEAGSADEQTRILVMDEFDRIAESTLASALETSNLSKGAEAWALT